jgi:hypothetical protein
VEVLELFLLGPVESDDFSFKNREPSRSASPGGASRTGDDASLHVHPHGSLIKLRESLGVISIYC